MQNNLKVKPNQLQYITKLLKSFNLATSIQDHNYKKVEQQAHKERH